MPEPWDCSCGTRNAGTFFHCRRCSAGRPAPPREPDEWTRIRVGTPISADIKRAVVFQVALIALFLLCPLALFILATVTGS